MIAALAALAPLAACSPSPAGDAGRITVIATIAPLADFVEQVGGDSVSVTLMVPPGADPHHYEPTPRQMVDVTNAAAYFQVGSGVEFELEWMDNLLAQNPDMAVVDCSAGIVIENNDPHIWTSPRNAVDMVRHIAAGLSLVDPDHAAEYEANADRYVGELRQLDTDITAILADGMERHFLIYHPSFAYFARDCGLVQLAIEEEGKSPSPHLLQDCVDLAAQHNLQYIYVSPEAATSEAQSIAEAIEGELLYVDPLPDSYLSSMRAAAEAFALEIE
jgi:zinc transport system substrate-binding protein